MFSLRLLLSFGLIFSQVQPGVAYKSIAYKKACNPKEKNIPVENHAFYCKNRYSSVPNGKAGV